MSGKKDSNGVNSGRRKVIKTFGATTFGSALGFSHSVRATKPKVITITGDWNSPLTREEIRSVRQRAAKAAGIENPRAKTANPDFGDSTLVGYAYYVDRDGRSRQVRTIAGDNESTTDMMNRVKHESQNLDGKFIKQKDASTSSTSIGTDSKSWTVIQQDTAIHKVKPYGELKNSHDWYELEGNSYDNYVPFAVHHDHKSKPGHLIWDDSNYYNYRAYPKHDWSPGNAEHITDYGPQGSIDTTDGSSFTKTIDLTVDGVTVSEDDSIGPGEKITDESDADQAYARWKNTYYNDARRERQVFQPGSAVLVPEQSSGTSDKVAELECIHRYIDNNIYPLEHTYDLVYNF